MTINKRTLRDAVRIVDVLEFAGSSITAHQFQLGLTTRRTFKALRFLQENGIIESTIEGSGSDRYKTYDLKRPGLPVICPQEEAA